MDPLGRCIAVYVIFLLLSAAFSVCAAVLNTLRSLDEDEKEDSAISCLYTKKNIYRFRLCAASVLCVMVCGGAAWYGFFDRFLALLPDAAPLAAILFFIICALPTALVGVLIPWALAEHYPTSDAVYSLVYFAKTAALVLTFLPELCFRCVLRLLSIEPDTARSDVTEQEILQLVDEGESSGAIDSEKREMIENIFDFSEHSVREVMTHYMDVAAIRSDASDEDIIAIISETGYSRYPVYTDDITEVTGILIAKEYLCDSLSPSPRGFSALVRKPLFVPDTMQTDEVLRRMKGCEQHMALVVNEYGEAVGLVTMEDLLEEIVGSIYDETDTSDDREPEVRALEDGSFEVHSTLSLDDLEEAADIELPSVDGIDTVGALVFSRLTTIPDDGVPIDVETDELWLHSDGLSERRLENVIVRVKEPEEPDDD